MTIYERLIEHRDEKYSEFQSKLVPNISPKTIIGVRTPDMRAVAKAVAGTDEAKAFLRAKNKIVYLIFYLLYTLFSIVNMVSFFILSRTSTITLSFDQISLGDTRANPEIYTLDTGTPNSSPVNLINFIIFSISSY